MKSPLRRVCSGLVLLATTASFGLLTTAGTAQATEERPPFYQPPASLPANNGDVIRAEPATFYLDPLKLIKVNADVQRIMYRSTDGQGRPTAVTGTVITPKAPWIGKGERPLVSYAAGTQGIGDHCAPSRQLAAGSEYEGLFVKGLVARGYAVVMTDYEGLGTPGRHTYVNRKTSGNAVLDAARAAQRLPGSRVPAAGPVAVTGYSQGGGAAAAAAELAPTYAPELHLKGVAAGAVPAELNAVAKRLDRSPYAGFLGYAVVGLAEGYDVDTDPYLNTRGRNFIKESERYCTIEAVARHAFTDSRRLTANGKPIADYLQDPRWKPIIEEQRIGRQAPKVPVLLNHSMLDDAIPYSVGRQLSKDWCAAGANVRFSPNLGLTHVGGAITAYPEVFLWLESRFAGLPAKSNC
ncbi:lipase [Streptomyces durbertensis]|uniref:Lipase n=1 Tax=Streptomyces durbertensis TaxID=2448886 RepID=A0ABR6EG73_9ACTN|nr:lipase family protein [Streptomyces durbertensis]MBB1244317.1 lipase [Streptomyces durbertensis]